MMAEVQTHFRELSAGSQAECFTSYRGTYFCMRLLMLNFHSELKSKLWFVSGEFDLIKLV